MVVDQRVRGEPAVVMEEAWAVMAVVRPSLEVMKAMMTLTAVVVAETVWHC